MADRTSEVSNGHFVRETFATSRRLEFCTEKELVAQTGYARPNWPAYAVQELFDNALDACEDVGTPPEIRLCIVPDAVEVADNGPGIPPETVDPLLDIDYRVSGREVYVSPCRGAQGNALKTLVMMPFVLDGTEGVVEIRARGVRHVIRVRVDHIAQCPVPEHRREQVPSAPGTTVRLSWPKSAAGELTTAIPQSISLAEDYTFFNPHLSLHIDCFGQQTRVERLQSGWKKWMPSQPPCAHWYDPQGLRAPRDSLHRQGPWPAKQS
jgi:DNA topoisomerase VI subunit B